MIQTNELNRGCGCANKGAISQQPIMHPAYETVTTQHAAYAMPQSIGGCGCPKTNVAPAVYHPVQEKVVHTYETTIVPHIYPTHTKMIHHHMYQLQNHYPQTVSNETQQYCVQQNCGGY